METIPNEPIVEDSKKTPEGKPRKHSTFTEELSTPEERRAWAICEKLQVRSAVWKHFWVYRDHKFAGAVCKHCYTERHENPRFTAESWEVKYGGVSANTSHLERHFKAHHKDLYAAERVEAGLAIESEPTKWEKDLLASKRKRSQNGTTNKTDKNSLIEIAGIPITLDEAKPDGIDGNSSSEDEADDPPKLPEHHKRQKLTEKPENVDSFSHSAEENKGKNFDLAYSCLIDVRKCRYKSINLDALIEEIGIDNAVDLQALDIEQQLLLAAVLKPAPSKTFREALLL